MADATADAANTEYRGRATPAKLLEIARYYLFIGVAVNAAVIGAILGATVILAEESFFVEQPTVPVPAAGAVLDLFAVLLALVTYWLVVRGVHVAYLIAAGGAIGVGAFFLV